jgi:hypothetical protein
VQHGWELGDAAFSRPSSELGTQGGRPARIHSPSISAGSQYLSGAEARTTALLRDDAGDVHPAWCAARFHCIGCRWCADAVDALSIGPLTGHAAIFQPSSNTGFASGLIRLQLCCLCRRRRGSCRRRRTSSLREGRQARQAAMDWAELIRLKRTSAAPAARTSGCRPRRSPALGKELRGPYIFSSSNRRQSIQAAQRAAT